MSITDLLQTITMMQDEQVMSSGLLFKCMSNLASRVQDMNAPELSFFYLITTSEAAHHFSEKAATDKEIGSALLKNAAMFGSQDIGKICYCAEVKLNAETLNMETNMAEFLSAKANEVQKWVQEGTLPVSDLAHILKAYNCVNV